METLSDKEFDDMGRGEGYYKKDVKEAVRRLKEDMIRDFDITARIVNKWDDKIDEIFGDKLT